MGNDTFEGENAIDPAVMPLVVAEYTNLRAEIIKLIELKHQLVSGALVAIGAFLGIGLQTGQSISLLLVYPLLALFLATMWAHHDLRTKQIAAYIRYLETRTTGLGWAHFLKNVRKRTKLMNTLPILSTGSFFTVTQTVAIGLVCLHGHLKLMDKCLCFLDIGAIVMTIIVLWHSRHWKESSVPELAMPLSGIKSP